ncbi:MAG TPA: outer membrane protein assembly factor BamD, partial [Polyangiaceae bacterium]
FVVVVFAALKFAVDARVDAIDAQAKHLRDENARMKQDLDDARQQIAERGAAELEAAKFFELIKDGRRVDVIKGWDAMKTKPLTKSEAQFFADAVERAKVEQATQLYLQGLDSVRLQRWQEAASAFEESLKYDDAASVSPQAKLELASADRKLHKQKDAIAILAPLVETSVDREVLDDALEQLAWCQTEIEAYNDAKNTWRTLLRKFPDSHYAPEAKLALQTLTQNH